MKPDCFTALGKDRSGELLLARIDFLGLELKLVDVLDSIAQVGSSLFVAFGDKGVMTGDPSGVIGLTSEYGFQCKGLLLLNSLDL